MKVLKKFISAVIVAILLFGTNANVGMPKVYAAEESMKSVFSIDAGRKYFSKEQIKKLIDYAKENNFTDIQLILGNDGLRFLLDDMDITVQQKEYDSEQVKNALIEGTKKYYDDYNGTYLNQNDMDEILKYARENNVGIIPTINSPGHMDAILNGMETLGMRNVKFTNNNNISKTTVDLSNKDALDFTKELVKKYASYFKGKVELFNFGGDEYANDATYHVNRTSGFKVLENKGLYDDFVNYVNDIAKIIKDNNLTPMCFNDGIYYNSNTSQGIFDKDIVIAYWTPGFENYTPATAKFLADKGHRIINTNDAWYYVVGRNNAYSGWYNLEQAKNGMVKSRFNDVPGDNGKQVKIVGSMICMWCDTPSKQYYEKYANEMMQTFAKNNPDYIHKSEESAVEDNRKKVILSIDAGRKYFLKDQLLSIIDHAATKGYSDVQLILGNDGLRFLLNDMSVKNYSSDDVKAAIEKGNKEYYNDPNGNYLTETEMREILDHAKYMNINIIPVINSPGHMDSILTAMRELGIENPQFQTSKRTLDIANDEAKLFTKELIKKYVSFFKDDCKLFNLGCDEYANDINTGGWSKLQASGNYSKFVEYVNDLCTIVKNANMKPVAFNDGIYYKSTDRFGSFDKDLIISYWTAGWWGYDVAKPAYFAEKGHKLLNTNDGWYYVLGDANSGYAFDKALDRTKNKIEFNGIPGGTSHLESIGSVQAVWADDPSKIYEDAKLVQLMDAFSTKHSQYMRDDKVQMADYQKVDNAISKMPKETIKYTKSSVEKANKAIEAVNRHLKNTDQVKVNLMAQAIENAIDQLEIIKANYTKVDEEINSIKDNLHLYTDESVYKLQNVIEGVDRNLDITKQSIVDGYVDAIKLAKAQLKLKEADYSKVQEILTTVPKDLSIYSEYSVEKLQNALKSIVLKLDITKQAQVDKMFKDVSEAVAELSLRKADYSEIDKIVDNAGDFYNYTEESRIEFNNILGSIPGGLDITKQSIVDDFAKKLYSAANKLVLKRADYTNLEIILDNVPADLNKYTDDSIKILKKAINDLIYGLDVTKQAQVDKMTANVSRAIDALKIKKIEQKQEVQEIKVSEKKENHQKNVKTTNKAVATSDSTNLSLLSALLLISGLSIACSLKRSKC